MPTPRPHSRWGEPRQGSGRWARAAEWPVALRGDGGHRLLSCCRPIGDPAANDDEEVIVPPRPQHRAGPDRRTFLRYTAGAAAVLRSEEHTSELQSRGHLVCRLLLEKKNSCVRHQWAKFSR